MELCKKILIMVLIIISSFLCTNQVYAEEKAQKTDVKGSKYVINPDYYDPSKEGISDEAKSIVTRKVGGVLGWIRNIAVVVSVITLMLIGLKYIIGSASEKAKYKETLIPWVIGCIVSVAGTTLVSFIYDAVT